MEFKIIVPPITVNLVVQQGTEVIPVWAKNLTDLIKQNKEAIMANLQDVKDEIAATKAAVADTRGAANSAVVLIDRLLTLIADAAANATDLDGLKADIASIHSETVAEKDELAAAVARAPA